MRREIAIVIGSTSDKKFTEKGLAILDNLKIPYWFRVLSAHRTPEQLDRFIQEVEGGGGKAIIAGAGMAAHLAGVIAAKTLLPVIGVPFASGPLHGVDALLSTAMMPPGIPVACMGIGSSGFTNGCLFALHMLAPYNQHIAKGLHTLRQDKRQQILAANQSDGDK